MICPLCEHQQEFGVECEVCGKDLGGLGDLGAPPVTTQALEDLEVTSSAPTGDVPVERIAELEVTGLAVPGAAVPAVEAVADFERNAAADVGEVQVERIEGMTVDRVADDGVRTEAPTGAVMCRYCRNVQAEGMICERCGMRLPKVAEVVIAGEAIGGPLIEAESVRCKACGAKAKVGLRCSECGALAGASSA